MVRRSFCLCVLVVVAVVAAGCGDDAAVDSASREPPSTSALSMSTTTSTSAQSGPATTGATGVELDAETARNRNLGSIGPDLATVAPAEAVSGQPIRPIVLTATDSDSPCPSLRFTAEGLPDGLEVTDHGDCSATVSGTVRGAPDRYVVTYRVTDDTGASDVSIGVLEARA